MDMKNLCLQLAYCDTENEIVQKLKESAYWENENLWQNFGNQENNFSTIGNQQRRPEAALVEKLINSVDAVLMGECMKRGISPNGSDAPKNIFKALEDFFNIKSGKLTNLTPSERKKIGNKIALVSTGKKNNPSYTIIDVGEGQTPKSLPNTILSIGETNKLRIPFVQGKFNMGGTGVFRFCGKRNLQLIISKRDPNIKSKYTDNQKDYWGFTVVRRENPHDGMRNSIYKYLAPNNEILKFKADGLDLYPDNYPEPYGKELKWGTFIKLFEYQMVGLKTNILFVLYNRLSLLMPNIALPIRFFERRKGYTGHTMETTLSGLSVRLEEDKRDNLEPGFPDSSEIIINGHRLKVSIHVFQPGSSEKYTKNEGVIFTINGQTHGFLTKSFFNRTSIGMGYLADSILILVDCTNFGGTREREDLFMNSRDRLAVGEVKDKIESQLTELIKNHKGLKELKERRRREEVSKKLENSRPFAEVLKDIVKKSPTLSRLFSGGNILSNPFKMTKSDSTDTFKGRKFPSFFKLEKEFTEDKPKTAYINNRFRIQFSTDVENNYFNREADQGKFSLKLNGVNIQDFIIHLWNGTATLTVTMPLGCRIGEAINFLSTVNDISQVEPFVNAFSVKIEKEIKHTNGKAGTRKKPPSDKNGNKNSNQSMLSIPQIFEILEKEWDKHKFDKESSLSVIVNGENDFDFHVNMDNVHLKREEKYSNSDEYKLVQARYKFGVTLLGLGIIYYNNRNKPDDEVDINKQIRFFSRAISPMLLPMINSLGELKIEELVDSFEEG